MPTFPVYVGVDLAAALEVHGSFPGLPTALANTKPALARWRELLVLRTAEKNHTTRVDLSDPCQGSELVSAVSAKTFCTHTLLRVDRLLHHRFDLIVGYAAMHREGLTIL